MKTLIKSAIVAVALAGAAMTATGSAQAASTGFYIGPNGVHVEYQSGYYYDRYHHRHYYRYPSDWQRYHHPREWYYTHPYWHRDRSWYRR